MQEGSKSGMAPLLPARSSSQRTRIARHVDRMFPKSIERDDVERTHMGRREHDRGSDASLVGLPPARRDHAPAVAWFKTGESVRGDRRTEVVADLALMREELGRHHGADGVA